LSQEILGVHVHLSKCWRDTCSSVGILKAVQGRKALWPTENSVMAHYWAMAHRLKTSVLVGISFSFITIPSERFFIKRTTSSSDVSCKLKNEHKVAVCLGMVAGNYSAILEPITLVSATVVHNWGICRNQTNFSK